VEYEEIIKKLKSLHNKKNVEGMARFGISSKNTLGVSVPNLRKIAKRTGKNHRLALKLWDSKIHEARILSSMVDDVNLLTEKQMDKWVKGFDSWDVCDEVCMNLFSRARFAEKKVKEWSRRKEEFVKRAAFALIATMTVHRKDLKDKTLLKFLPIIQREAKDERNFVRKAVNWALRQIGKRNDNLKGAAIKTAESIGKMNSKSAKWIAKDALRELKGR